MIEQKQKKSAIFCAQAQMIDFCRPGHISIHKTVTKQNKMVLKTAFR